MSVPVRAPCASASQSLGPSELVRVGAVPAWPRAFLDQHEIPRPKSWRTLGSWAQPSKIPGRVKSGIGWGRRSGDLAVKD